MPITSSSGSRISIVQNAHRLAPQLKLNDKLRLVSAVGATTLLHSEYHLLPSSHSAPYTHITKVRTWDTYVLAFVSTRTG
jgi:hypothetical protein